MKTTGVFLVVLFAASLTSAGQPLAPSDDAESEDRQDCHPSYEGACVPFASDVDCAGGSGDGPEYVGRVRVVGPDVYQLDRDGNGIGCE